MIDQATLFTYLAILLGFVFIPGPAVLLTLARATSSGTKVGIATGFGIAVGDIIHTLMAVIGLSAIVLTSSFLFNVIKYLGAAYLIYIGICAILERRETTLLNEVQTITAVKAFKQAILVETLNPKSALFFLAFLPQFVTPENGMISLQLTILGVLFVAMGLFSTLIVALCAGGASHYFVNNPLIQRWQGRFVGSIYCGSGIRIAFQEK